MSKTNYERSKRIATPTERNNSFGYIKPVTKKPAHAGGFKDFRPHRGPMSPEKIKTLATKLLEKRTNSNN